MARFRLHSFRIHLKRERNLGMAQKVHIVIIDDLDGSDATETVTFGLDGSTYEIDLNNKNAKKLRDALAPYVGNSRKVTAKRGRPPPPNTAAGAPPAREVRDGARSNGYKLPDLTRGV